MLISDVRFHNFNSEKYETTAFGSCTFCWDSTLTISGGKTTRMEKLQFHNTTKKVWWEKNRNEIYWDMDGSLTGVHGQNGGAYVTPYYPHLNDIKHCKRNEDSIYDDAIVCSDDV